MTRINLVRPEDLADQHLFAEWREIKMIAPSLARSLNGKSANEVIRKIPSTYTLNTGHVMFFYDKLPFLDERFKNLTAELLQRQYDIPSFNFHTDHFKNGYNSIPQWDWTPTKADIQLNIDRISERLHQRPTWYRYYGEIMTPEFFIDRYNQQLLVDTIIA